MTRRKLKLPSGVWEYYISGRLTVIIWSPSGEKYVTDAGRVKDMRFDDVERGQRKGTPSGYVQPAHIRDYIEREMDHRRMVR